MQRFKRTSDIRAAVIGYGPTCEIGRVHLQDMRAAGMTLTAVADRDPARLAVARNDFPGIETYASAAELLKRSKVNLVVVATPHNTHAAVALQCLRAGRHVVCEKPLAVTTAQCDTLLAAARRHKVLLSAFHNRHWDGCILRARRVVHAGTIGEVVRVEMNLGRYAAPDATWRNSRSIAGSILHDWGVHMLEYALQLVDSQLMEVSGFVHQGFWAKRSPWKDDALEDEGFLVARFANGARVSLCMSTIDSRPEMGWVDITGTRGAYHFAPDTWRLTRQLRGGAQTTEGKNPPSQWPRYYRNIADHLVRGTPLVITPEWARRPIHIIDLALRSARLGRSLRARYP